MLMTIMFKVLSSSCMYRKYIYTYNIRIIDTIHIESHISWLVLQSRMSSQVTEPDSSSWLAPDTVRKP